MALTEYPRAPVGAGDNLNPPPALLILLVQSYILIGGVSYFYPSAGFLAFLGVNVVANIFLMGGAVKANANK